MSESAKVVLACLNQSIVTSTCRDANLAVGSEVLPRTSVLSLTLERQPICPRFQSFQLSMMTQPVAKLHKSL